MEPSGPQSPNAKLWQVLRAVYYVLLKGFSKHKLTLHLHLLSKRGKIAARAIGGALLAAQPHVDDLYHVSGNAANYLSTLSCRSMDPATAVYRPREVEFSCSNTPLHYSSFHRRGGGGPHHHHRRHRRRSSTNAATRQSNLVDSVATVTRLFELLDMKAEEASDDDEIVMPSPAIPAAAGPARQVRITDSPFPEKEEEVEEAGKVDRRAEVFITWFHEQLRLQQQSRERATYHWAR